MGVMVRTGFAILTVMLAMTVAPLSPPARAAESRTVSPAASGAAVSGAPVKAQPQAAQAISNAEFENRPLNFAPPSHLRRDSQTEDKRPASAYPSILPPLIYVGLICGLFIAILTLVKKYLPGHKRLFAHPSMEILGRTHIDQRRYVSLLRVGKRIIVIGVSPDEMTSLSEITDDEEITRIMEVARPKTESGLNIFQRLFQHSVVEAEEEVRRHTLSNQAEEKAKELDENMASLRERVRSIRDLEGKDERLDITG